MPPEKARFDRWHSRCVLFLSVAVLLQHMCGGSIPLATATVLCFLSVLVVGLPHGALDHRVGQRVLSAWRLPDSLGWFVGLYLAVGLAVLLLWYVFPLGTILVFFGVSAWHFGLEEDGVASRNFREQLGRLALGGMVIWVPCLCQPDHVRELLQTIMPTEQSWAAEAAVALVGGWWPLWVLLCLDHCLWSQVVAAPAAPASRWAVLLVDRTLRVAALGATMAVVHPLVSFTLYFCGWHSIRGLRQLYVDFGDSVVSFVAQLLPFTLAAIALFLGGAALGFIELGWRESLIRVSFLGLSAVAIPHLLLHVAAQATPSMGAVEGRGRLTVARMGHWIGGPR